MTSSTAPSTAPATMDGATAQTRIHPTAVVHPGAVMVIPMLETPDGLRLVMERQFRYPVGQVMTEFPAGKLDPGEDPWLCAQRELQEETGYTARQWARAGVLHPVISYSTEVIEIWFAKELSLGERSGCKTCNRASGPCIGKPLPESMA